MTEQWSARVPDRSRWRRKTDGAEYTVAGEPTWDGYVRLIPQWLRGRRMTRVACASLLRRYERIQP